MGHGKGIPPDVLALSVPMAFAATMFGFMVSRAFIFDPEWSNGITPETAEWNKKGDVYRNQIGGFFRAGPGRATSVFNNEVIIKDS